MLSKTDIRERVLAAKKKWEDTTNIEEIVSDIIQKSLYDIIKTTLGFRRNNWSSGWEIDTSPSCRNSSFSTALSEKVSAVALRLVTELFTDKIEFTNVEKTKFQELYKAKINAAIKFIIEERAVIKAEQELDRILDEVIDADSTAIEISNLVRDASPDTKSMVLDILKSSKEN